MSTPKVPRTPPAPLTITDGDLVEWPPGPLWRIARTSGDHVLPWNRPRDYGPVATCRWDPQTPPASIQPTRAVLYAATNLATAAAEVWQATRRIDPHTGTPVAARFTPARPLRLLDLTGHGTWAIRHGASAQLPFAPRPVCRTWARAIHTTRPDLDGLLTPSTMSGRNVVLFPGWANAIPTSADLLARCDDPAMMSLLAVIAETIGYRI